MDLGKRKNSQSRSKLRVRKRVFLRLKSDIKLNIYQYHFFELFLSHFN